MLRRILALLLLLCALPYACMAEEMEGDGEIPEDFVLFNGDRSIPKIALTVDDCYRTSVEWIEKDVELCRKYGVAMTFFPVVYTGCLEEEYRNLWQSVLDCGCEIGTHTIGHTKLGNRRTIEIIEGLGLAQEALDRTLGYHYEVRWLRPPYGSIARGRVTTQYKIISSLRQYGFERIVRWDVSETRNLQRAISQVQNGSILLFHSKRKDTLFMDRLIPELKALGFEMVTVSELFGYDPPEAGGEPYVFHKSDFQKKRTEETGK